MKIPKGAKTKKITIVDLITVMLEVTAEDIKYGKQHETRTCAIARALKNTFDEKDVDVDSDAIKVDGYQTVSVPKVAQNFIIKFDEDKKSVKPFKFQLVLKKNNEEE